MLPNSEQAQIDVDAVQRDKAEVEQRLRAFQDEIAEVRSSRDEASQDSKLQHGVMKNQVADPRARHEQPVKSRAGVWPRRLSLWSKSCTTKAWKRIAFSSSHTSSSWSRGPRELLKEFTRRQLDDAETRFQSRSEAACTEVSVRPEVDHSSEGVRSGSRAI